MSGADAQHNKDQLRYRRAAFYSQLKSKVSNILAKATALRISLTIYGALYLHEHTLKPPTSKPLASYSLPSPSVSPSLPPLHLDHLVCARLRPPPA